MSIYKHFPLNGTTIVEVKDNKLIASSYKGAASKVFLTSKSTNTAEAVLNACRGKTKVFVHSDLFELSKDEYTIEKFDNKTVEKLYHNIIETSVYDLAEISKHENIPLLYQSTFDEKSGFLFITVGLLKDIRLVLLNIRRKD